MKIDITNAKPILFNTEMVKTILDGRKTQAKRVINLKNKDLIFTGFIFSSTCKKREGCCSFGLNKERDLEYVKPKYKVGDILYVKETFLKGYIECGYDAPDEDDYGIFNSINGKIIYKADHIKHIRFNNIDANDKEDRPIWTPSIHMKKEDARIFLKVTNVRVERLQDMSYEDLRKEGIWHKSFISNKTVSSQRWNTWKKNWNSTVKDGYKWEDNPYVFVYEFERI